VSGDAPGGPPQVAEETVGGLLSSAARSLQSSPVNDSPRLDAELLLAHVLGWTKTEIHIHITDKVAERDRKAFWELIGERQKGLPIAYLVGWREFYSRRFWVRPGVLVPRPETELLVEEALDLLRRTPGATRVLDLCCGSGCIGITLALETLTGQVVASDIDATALAQTEENVKFFGVENRVQVVESDLFAGLGEMTFDLIVSNPPYVGTDVGPRPDPEVAAHEPSVALFSGRDGTDHLKTIVERAPAHLIEGGSLVIECACFQAEKIEAWMDSCGYSQTRLWHDLTGLPRGVSGRWEGNSP
jgi:release factor glutamine methyltransferase